MFQRLTRFKRSLALLGAVVALTGASAFASAAPAGASTTCPLEYACVFNSAGTNIYQNPNTVNGLNVGGGTYVWNNGKAFAGADHITLHVRSSGGSNWNICLHYGARKFWSGGADNNPTAVYLVSGDVVTGWNWRGECGASEDISWDLVP